MTPKVRTLHQQAELLAADCHAELRSISDWLEGVGYGVPSGLPPSCSDLEALLRHLREVCYRLHDTLEAQTP